MKPRVVSGMRPTGKLHLGHLVGALQNWAGLQEPYDCFYFVADWHALTSDYSDTSGIVPNAYDMVADWIAAGIDPERSTLVRAVAGAGACRAEPAPVDDGADSLARTRSDLQGAD